MQFQEPYIILTNGFKAQGIMTTIKAISRISENKLLGENLVQEAEVDQWMEYCHTNISPYSSDLSEMKNIAKVVDSNQNLSRHSALELGVLLSMFVKSL